MNRIPLKATEREILGKKVAKLRREGFLPAHVFGNKVETEHVTVKLADFKKVYDEAGETGLIDLRIGEEKVRPVLIREVQVHAVTNAPLHIDFYQVNLKEKVAVAVPIELIGEEAEIVHKGEAVLIQPMTEVQVEALPAELPEKIVVDTTSLQAIDDAITVAQLQVPEGVTILAEPEAVVVKLDTAVTAEMEALMEEAAAETEAAQEAAAAEEGGEAKEGEESAEGETAVGEKEGEVESPEDKQERVDTEEQAS